MKQYLGLEYQKINTVFKRDEQSKRIIEGDMTLPEFEFLKNNLRSFTEKVDGTNTRICRKNGELSINGRTNDSQIPSHLLSTIDTLFNTPQILAYLSETFSPETEVVFFGEGYGRKIQKVGELYGDTGFVLFDINIDGRWLDRENMLDIAGKMGLKVVPEYFVGTLQEAIEMVRTGITSKWGDFMAEGLVGKPIVNLYSKKGERIITKIKHRDFTFKK